VFFLKKVVLFLVTIISLFVVSGCQSPTATEQSSTYSQTKTEKVTITLAQEGKELTKKTVDYQPKQTLLQLLKQQFTVEEENGFITAIDHHTQDKDKGIYWTFTINGHMAEKGANEIKLANNDKVVFNLAPFK
jgi:hypothetical protein